MLVGHVEPVEVVMVWAECLTLQQLLQVYPLSVILGPMGSIMAHEILLHRATLPRKLITKYGLDSLLLLNLLFYHTRKSSRQFLKYKKGTKYLKKKIDDPR